VNVDWFVTQRHHSPQKPPLSFNEHHHFLQSLLRGQAGHDEGAVGAHAAGVFGHGVEVDADVGSEVGFVDDQQVRAGDAGAAFAGDFFAAGDIDDVDRQIG